MIRFAPALALLLAGCAVGPDYVRPAAIVPAEYKEIKGWKRATPADDKPRGPWWACFHDSELDRLMPQVAVSNQTLKADEANYREALALIAEAKAGLYPTINASPGVARASGAGTTVTAELTGSWSPDVWGKIRRSVESQGAAAEASAADLANATLSAQSALALAYFQLREADSLHDLLVDTAKQYQRSLDIAQNQYNAGTTSRSDVLSAQAQLLAAQAQAVNTGVARAQNEHAIAVLIGRPPAELSIRHGALPRDPPIAPVRLPSSLLERRPDIAAAERTMQEQNAAIGVAIAGYYPDLTLSGLFGYSGNPFIHAISGENPVWLIALTGVTPLFNGGLTAAEVEAARQTYGASVATYRQTVLTAFQQVEDQLAAIRILAHEATIQAQATAAAEQAVQIALNEYRAGTQNYTTVVTAQANALSDEESALTTRAQRMAATVSLIVALGGGWTRADLPDLTEPASGQTASR